MIPLNKHAILSIHLHKDLKQNNQPELILTREGVIIPTAAEMAE